MPPLLALCSLLLLPPRSQAMAIRRRQHALILRFPSLPPLAATGKFDNKFRLWDDDDSPEASEDNSHSATRPQKPARNVSRIRKIREEKLEQDPPLAATGKFDNKFLLGEDDDSPEYSLGASKDFSNGIPRPQKIERHISRIRKIREEQPEQDPPLPATDDKFFGEIDSAFAARRAEPPAEDPNPNGPEELSPEATEVLRSIEELDRFQDGWSPDDDVDDDLLDPDSDLMSLPKPLDELRMPVFEMTLAELLDESRLVPISVSGDLSVEITGIQQDAEEVSPGDLFVCSFGRCEEDWRPFLSEADKRGAVAVVGTREINIDNAISCRALIIVEDICTVLGRLAASFHQYPSRYLSVTGITGTSGKTITAHLVQGIYEAMGYQTGMTCTLGYFLKDQLKLDDSESLPDSLEVQELMATMLLNGTEALVLEASSQGLGSGYYDQVDFDVAVFTNLACEEHRDDLNSKAKLFAKMVDPKRHRKVVNIDDPNAPFFIKQGNKKVPVVTFSMENRSADVHILSYSLSCRETSLCVSTPRGTLSISSCLLGRYNIYNILAAVAVGIALGAPLEDILQGVQKVDVVPGRCERIDCGQDFTVIVDQARTPEALSHLLDTVRELGGHRVITAVGSQGGERAMRPVMTKIAADKSDIVILTCDNPGEEERLGILNDMFAGVGWTIGDYMKYADEGYVPCLPNGHRIFAYDIRKLAVRCAVAMGEEDDIVVITGKGDEPYQLEWEEEKDEDDDEEEGESEQFLDDRQECREALENMHVLHEVGIDTSELPWRLPQSH